MPGISKFWDGLEMEWIRRMKESEEVWRKHLELKLLKINHSLFDVRCMYGSNTFRITILLLQSESI